MGAVICWAEVGVKMLNLRCGQLILSYRFMPNQTPYIVADDCQLKATARASPQWPVH